MKKFLGFLKRMWGKQCPECQGMGVVNPINDCTCGCPNCNATGRIHPVE